MNKLELTTMEQRRERGDLIQIRKILNGLEDIHLVKGLTFVDSDHFRRGNSLRRELFETCSVNP